MLMPPPGVGEMLGMPSSGSLHPRSIARHSSWGRVCGSRVRVSLPLPPSWDSHWQHHPVCVRVCVRVCVCVCVLHCTVWSCVWSCGNLDVGLGLGLPLGANPNQAAT